MKDKCVKTSNKIDSVIEGTPKQRIGSKFIISGFIDLLDFFMPPVIGTFYDAFAIWVAIKLWGNAGYFGLWEILDFTDRGDAFIPTVTLIGLYTTFVQK